MHQAKRMGGAVFADLQADYNKPTKAKVTIKSTDFINCRSGFGGAYLQLGGKLAISNSTFKRNVAQYDGGAIYTSYVDGTISLTYFFENSLMDSGAYAGAAYFDMGNVVLKNNVFTHNTGPKVATLFARDTNLTLQKNAFDNPSNVTSIYTEYGKVINNGGNSFASDKRSYGNKDGSSNFKNLASTFVILNNTLHFDELPAKFDLRDYGWVSPVENQGFSGSCTLFGTFAALESTLIRYANITASLSENNAQNLGLQYSRYGGIGSVEGLSPLNSLNYLMDWFGVFPGEHDEYDELGKISPLITTPEDIHIQNIVILPSKNEPGAIDAVKWALINYGAVCVEHTANFNESLYFNNFTNAQYYFGKYKGNDHRVCIVGWDDGYASSNFLEDPVYNGAWIVKNSWGTDWGDGGYFYMSYYDTSVLEGISYAFILNNDSYERVYQHDTGGEIALNPYYKYSSNKFTVEEDGLVAAFGTYFNKTGDKYEIWIGVNGIDLYHMKGVAEFEGYATVELDKLIQVKKGDDLIIILKNAYAPHTYNSRSHADKGESFFSKDSNEWLDVASENYKVILKLYTVSDLNITQNLVKYYGSDDPFVANVGAEEEVIFEFRGKKYSVIADENGTAMIPIVDYNKAGGYPITTTYKNISIINYVQIESTIVSSNVVRAINSNCNYKVQVADSKGNILMNTKVPIYINGKLKYYRSDKSGNIVIKFAKLTKSQKIMVRNTLTGEDKTTTIRVVSRFSGAANVVMYYFDGSKFKVKVIGNNGKAVGKNQIVVIKLNKKTYRVKTNAKGYAILKIPSTVKPGTYKLTASYKGQTIKKVVKVKQNLRTKKFAVKKSAKKLVVYAVLKNGKKAIKNKIITLKINGKAQRAITNKKGVAKFVVKKNVINKLRAGKRYPMSFTYLKNTIRTILAVRR